MPVILRKCYFYFPQIELDAFFFSPKTIFKKGGFFKVKSFYTKLILERI